MRLLKTLPLTLAAAVLASAQVFPSSIYTPLVAADNIQSKLNVAMGSGDAVAIVDSTTGWAPNMVAYICDATTVGLSKCTGTSELMLVTSVANSSTLNVTRGYAGSTAVTHASGKFLSNAPTAVYTNNAHQEIAAIENALGANLSKVQSGTAFEASTYNFAPRSPSGTLSAGTNTITMSIPLGVNGTDVGHSLYIAGTGTPESCLIVGGGGIAGDVAGQLQISCAGSHSAGYTVASATAGWQEADQGRKFYGSGKVHARGGTYQFRAPVTYSDNSVFEGDGDSTKIIPASSTAIVFVNRTSQPGGGSEGSSGVVFRSFLIDGGSYTGVNGIYGIRMNLQDAAWTQSISNVVIDRISFNNVRWSVYGERINKVSISNIQTWANSGFLITDTTGNPTYRNFSVVFEKVTTHYTYLDGTGLMSLGDYIFRLDKCVSCLMHNIDITGTIGNAGGIKVAHASEGVVISDSTMEMYGASGNPFRGIYLAETTMGGVTVSPTATQINNVIVDMASTVAGLRWEASTFGAGGLSVSNSLFTANPTTGGVIGLQVDGTSVHDVSLTNVYSFGSFSTSNILLSQGPTHVTITGGSLLNSHGTGACLKNEGAVNYLSVTSVDCQATSGTPLVDTYGIQSSRHYWGNIGTTPIPNLLHSPPAGYSSEAYTTGNGFGRTIHGTLSGSSSDWFTITGNYNRTAAAAGAVDNNALGTTEVALEPVNGGGGIVHLRSGAVNTAPTDVMSCSSASGCTMKAVAAAALPTCNSGAAYSFIGVSDSNTVTWGATVAGGGANKILAFCDGSNWTVAGK